MRIWALGWSLSEWVASSQWPVASDWGRRFLWEVVLYSVVVFQITW